VSATSIRKTEDVLGRVCRVDDNAVLSLVVGNEIGIIVALPLPYVPISLGSSPGPRLQLDTRLTHRYRLNMHVARSGGLARNQ